MLMRSCGTDPTVLRARIIAADHSALKLYRGFSRFMTEDLAQNQYTKHLSRSKLKQRACNVSFDMIQRNEAYSNLVGLFFPNHVRLSIHAHDNSGPKFGITMFPDNVRALDKLSLSADEMRSVDLLHVPTPWHNCIVSLAGQSTLIMTKSKVVRDALARGEFTGGWQNDVPGHFQLYTPGSKPAEERQCEDVLDCCAPV